jgi:hypothetical protein
MPQCVKVYFFESWIVELSGDLLTLMPKPCPQSVVGYVSKYFLACLGQRLEHSKTFGAYF